MDQSNVLVYAKTELQPVVSATGVLLCVPRLHTIPLAPRVAGSAAANAIRIAVLMLK